MHTKTKRRTIRERTNIEQTRAHVALASGRPKRAVPKSQAVRDIVAIGYLRAFVTLLVLAHHAVLAYHTFAPAQVNSLLAQPRWWQAFPVADAVRSGAVALFAGWNDTVLMALMFFLSGLFVSTSVERQGARSFLTRRLTRLGLPFVAVVAIVAPLAYYPAYLGTQDPQGVAGFVREWLSLGNWPAGPGWFLWLLLAFDAVAVGLFALWPKWAASLARQLSWMVARPVRCFAGLTAVTALAYLPFLYVVGPLHWTAVGPFSLQTSRLFFYALYFCGGIVLGARGLGRGLLDPNGRLARRWPIWVAAAVASYVFSVQASNAGFAPGASAAVRHAADLGFVIACATSCFALLSLFLRFARRPRPLFDSLRGNAYGMYIVHYAFVSWLQLSILPLPLTALGKATVVTTATVLLSWATTAALRRVPAFRRLI
jgi:hypothetical protein